MTSTATTDSARGAATAAWVAAHGLTPEEWQRACEVTGRDPTTVELAIFGALWSEHASYKSSRAELRRLPSGGAGVRVGPGENAGVIDIGDGLCVCFKLESKNHAASDDPRRGGALGAGGILRDIFTMGARPVALLNGIGLGLHDDPRTRARLIALTEGLSGYSNGIGVPTVGGMIAFDAGHADHVVANVMAVGIVRADAIFLGRAAGAGNPVLYVGAVTGRDGIGRSHVHAMAAGEPVRPPTAQIADPFAGKRLLEACLELFSRELVVGIQDLGGAGLAGSAFEMASRAGTGIDLDLDDVPTRGLGLTATEILLSESPERMLLVCRPDGVGAVVEIFTRWDLECAVVGHVTDSGRVRARLRGAMPVDLPARPLAAEVPEAARPRQAPVDLAERWLIPPGAALSREPVRDLLTLVASPNLASRRWLFEQFDSTVRLGTVAGSGRDAALVRVLGTSTAIGLTVDVNARFVTLDPRRGAALAVCEGVRNLACVGASPLGVTDCLNLGSTESPETMWSLSEIVTGLADASLALDVPVVSGNVSFFHGPADHDEPARTKAIADRLVPTPMCGVVGRRTDLPSNIEPPSSAFREEGDLVALVGQALGQTLGGSEFLYVLRGLAAGRPPEPRFELELAVSAACAALVRDGLVASAHDVAAGGLYVTLAECTACHHGRHVGATVDLPDTEDVGLALFGEAGARIVVSYPASSAETVRARAAEFGAVITPIGRTGGAALVVRHRTLTYDIDLERLHTAWDLGFERALRVGRCRDLTIGEHDAI